MLIKSYVNIIIIFFAILLSQFISSKSISFEGNKKIETFYESKIILRDIFQNNQYTFYCSCSYEHKKPIFKACGYKPYKNFKRANRIEWEHVVPASRFGKKFETWKNGNLKCIKNGKKFKGRKCTRKINQKFRIFTFIVAFFFIGAITLGGNSEYKNRMVFEPLKSIGIFTETDKKYFFTLHHHNLFKAGLNMFYDKPLLGHGPKMFRVRKHTEVCFLFWAPTCSK